MLSGTLVRPRGVLRALRAQRPERQELRRAWWHKRSIITHSNSHTRQQQRGCGWLDAILTTPPPARGCEERCRDRVQAQPPPWRQRPQKRRTKIRQASEPVRHQRLTHPVTCMYAAVLASCALVCTSVTDQRLASRWPMSRSPAGDGPFLDPAERDDSRHVGTPRC